MSSSPSPLRRRRRPRWRRCPGPSGRASSSRRVRNPAHQQLAWRKWPRPAEVIDRSPPRKVYRKYRCPPWRGAYVRRSPHEQRNCLRMVEHKQRLASQLRASLDRRRAFAVRRQGGNGRRLLRRRFHAGEGSCGRYDPGDARLCGDSKRRDRKQEIAGKRHC